MQKKQNSLEQSYSLKKQHTLQYFRHFTQILSFIFLNGKILGLMGTGIIVPYLHVTQAPFSTAHGAYESLEFTIARGVFPLLVLGVIYLTASTVGRVFCGWACPFGLVQDLMSYLPFRKQRLSANTVQQLKDIKWVVLGLSLFSSILIGWRRAGSSMEENPMGVFSDSPFSVVSPAGTLFAYLPWMMIWNGNVLAVAGLVAWVKIAVLIAVLVPSLYVPRFFCRYVCPMGALLEPATPLKALRINKAPKLTNQNLNKLLEDVCPMGVQLDKDRSSTYIDSPSCVHCGKCVTEEPKYLEPKFSFSS
eukprot:TRINITY_DN724_c0_g1_i1.p1 TRINITY_DN724_c0_g1~~TRINITY_DN724_c0_g1_i1.p1  ORF type:complete len:315 (+),score=51.02 TRINITY_DN724_c0_g1_i1:31-945(+)